MATARGKSRRSSGPTTPVTSWKARLALLSVGVVFGLLLAEVAVRLVRRPAVLVIPWELYTPAEPDGFALEPGYVGEVTNRVEFRHDVSVNRLGLRGPEVEPRDADERILLLGDSFVFGVGVEQEETLGAVLEELYAAEGRSVVALNGGVPAYGVPDAAGQLARLAPAVMPDRVAMFLFTGNDLAESQQPFRQPRAVGGLREWLYYRSDLFVLAKTAVPTRVYARIAGWFTSGEPARVRRLRQASEIYRTSPPDWVVEGASAARRALERMAATSREGGADFVVLIIPELLQLEPHRLASTLADLGVDQEGYDPGAPTALFARMLTELDLPFVDLTEVLAAAHERGDGPYYPIDRHWTAEGHRLVAQATKALLDSLEAPAPAADAASPAEAAAPAAP